ncbi:radical SAM family heme chaperone HemW [Bradymonas sediminis]|uniref:Heme chaperone HemW n=1 Tax=Bradymonas sediminis TaxID=1548548 RepID=A0A2Z4FRG8_9DELT|nr:radical SAM family heme chaperone HemW [Bradymonas sediminis]AWV91314.1 coproporphyrinogen III oxidase [Bradymonas sediminis]TDP73892.1 oxygen-independent coproporphyrinogen-3 oxidase [Bradymonas sediminis]
MSNPDKTPRAVPPSSTTNAPVRRRRDQAVGIYVHVPFCARKCPYCDFAVDVRASIPHQRYAHGLIREFERRKHELEGRTVHTIYLGGGTPSIWDLDAFRHVMEHLQSAIGTQNFNEIEICMEANPVNITRENLRAWTDAGVTRLSIGCQSFQARILKILNRNHTRDQALSAVEMALEHGPGVVSLDLIYGNPEQTMDEWARDLDTVEALEGLKHLSAYNLTIEPGTAFKRRRDRGRLALPDDDLCFEMLDYLIERAEAMGLERYEVSNFARPGYRSRHNTLYWTGAEYLGLGVGAHSLRIDTAGSPNPGIFRHANPRLTDAYLSAPGEPAPDSDSAVPLSAREHFIERLFLGVRTRAGLDFAGLQFQFEGALPEGLLQKAEALLDELCDAGFLTRQADIFVPTHLGLNVADGLAQRFADAL